MGREFLLKNKVYTTSSVLAEIKDPEARAIARECFQDFKILNPCKQAMFFVNRFTKATGDFFSLSQTDTEVIALAIELIQKRKKLSLINKMPEQVVNHVREKSKKTEGEAQEGESNEQDEEEEPEQEEKNTEENVPEKENKENEESKESKEENSTKKPLKLWNEGVDYDQDDEEGWITKDNYKSMLSTKVEASSESDAIGVSIVTSDYAMQNTILQMKIPLRSYDNMLITKVRSYVLECFTCQGICKDVSKVFCPSCKYDTLLKVTCSFNADGSLVLYRKKNYKVNLRGKKYHIPKFGRVNDDLILTEDQLEIPAVKKKLMKQDKYNQKQHRVAEMAYNNGWGFESIKKHNKNFRTFTVGYGNKNP